MTKDPSARVADLSPAEERSLVEPAYNAQEYSATLQEKAKKHADFYAIKVEAYRLFTDTSANGDQSSIMLTGPTFSNDANALRVRLLFYKKDKLRTPFLFRHLDRPNLLDIYFGLDHSPMVLEQLKERHCFVQVENLTKANWRVTIRTPPFVEAS